MLCFLACWFSFWVSCCDSLQALKYSHAREAFEISGCAGSIDACCSFLSLKIRQLAGKLRAMKEDSSLWETFQKKLSMEEYEKISALLKTIEIGGKARLPIAVEKTKPLSKGNFENQLVLWSPPKPSATLDFAEAGEKNVCQLFNINMFVFIFFFANFPAGRFLFPPSRTWWFFGPGSRQCVFFCSCSSSQI